MKKYIFLAASALVLASCSSDDFLGENPGNNPSSAQTAISFGGTTGKISRANEITGAAAATALGNNFIVYGTKTVDNKVQTVFNDYKVTYDATKNWEYAGISNDQQNANQTIKYWDYSASQYDFIAYSLGKETATASGTATASKITINGYTLTGTEEQLANCYIADKKTVKKTDFNNNNKVTLEFHSLASKVTIGIYETIPGYSVKDVKFYTSDADAKPSTTPALYTTENTISSNSTTMTATVSYPNDATTPTVTLASASEQEEAQTNKITFGTLKEGYLATEKGSATKPTDPTRIFPANAGDLTLKVDYTLESVDGVDGSKETINIKGATVKVPAQYTKWQANFIYTYIFNITENTNGSTGGSTDPAGLYPIKFDAVVKENQSNSENEFEFKKDESTTEGNTDEGN